MDTPTAASDRPLTLTPRQAARELGCSRSYLYRLIKAQAIPTTTVGKRARVLTADLIAYLEAGRRQANT